MQPMLYMSKYDFAHAQQLCMRVYLQELVEGLLAALQLVQYGDQGVSDASSWAQRNDSVVSLNVWHYRPVVHT